MMNTWLLNYINFFSGLLLLLSGMEMFVDPDSSTDRKGTRESPFRDILSALEYSKKSDDNPFFIINFLGEPKFYLNCKEVVYNISGKEKGVILRTTSIEEKKSILSLNPFFVSNGAHLEFENMRIFLFDSCYSNDCSLLTLINRGTTIFKVFLLLRLLF